jgi:AraC family transcriptional regulator of arabinose operon
MPRLAVSFGRELVAGRTDIRAEGHRPLIYREHGMDGWVLNLTVEGRGRVGRGAGLFRCHPGELLLFRPSVMHDYGADDGERWSHLWVYFFPRPQWLEWLTWPEAAPGIPRLDARGNALLPRIRALFEELIATANGPRRRSTALAMSLLEQLLLWCDELNPSAGEERLDPRIQAAVARLGAHPERRHRLDELARACGLSASRLSHLFRTQLGTTPMRWLEERRIHRARELLLMTGGRIGDIAAEVGFPDTVWFTRCFRRQVGVSPRQFRAAGGGAER